MPHLALMPAANARLQPRGATLVPASARAAACVPNQNRRRPLSCRVTASNAQSDARRENDADGTGTVNARASHASMRSSPRRLCLLGGLAASATCVPLFVNSSSWAAVDAKQPSPPPPKFDAFPSGLRLLKIRAGEGLQPEEGDEVEINFTARLASKQGWFFENTYNPPGKDGFPVPFGFTVGDGTVIPGLDEAVRQMSKGEIVRAVIPPALSYQNKSQGPIPREWSNRRRLYSTVFNEVRQANGEGGTAAEPASEFAAPPGLCIRLCTERDASCERTVERIVDTANAAYLFGEQGLWRGGVASRTNAEEIAELLRGGKLILLTEARSGGEVVGSVLVEVPEDARGSCGELGMLNVAEAYRKSGSGRALIAAAEERCRAFGCRRIRLQLLTPKDFVHPIKVWLERWYTQLGYVKQGSGEDFGKEYPHIQPLLSCSCVLTDYTKELID